MSSLLTKAISGYGAQLRVTAEQVSSEKIGCRFFKLLLTDTNHNGHELPYCRVLYF
jgi:hypothetical protein